jgi:hypothetical protein
MVRMILVTLCLTLLFVRPAFAEESAPEAFAAEASVPAPAPATEPDPARVPPTLNVEATLGVGSPVGTVGVGGSARPSDRLGVSAGAGFGAEGPQLAAMLHGYPITTAKHARVGVGAGISTGEYSSAGWRDLEQHWERYVPRAWFLNLQASALIWERSGFGAEPFAGYAFVLNGRDGACAGWRSTCSRTSGVFFLGITLRYGRWL